MSSISKPSALAVAAVTASATGSALAGAPAWVTAAATLVPLAAGAVTLAADQLREGRREQHHQARQDAADAQLRRLERQAAQAVRTITDPDRKAEALLRLIDAHRASDPIRERPRIEGQRCP